MKWLIDLITNIISEKFPGLREQRAEVSFQVRKVVYHCLGQTISLTEEVTNTLPLDIAYVLQDLVTRYSKKLKAKIFLDLKDSKKFKQDFDRLLIPCALLALKSAELGRQHPKGFYTENFKNASWLDGHMRVSKGQEIEKDGVKESKAADSLREKEKAEEMKPDDRPVREFKEILAEGTEAEEKRISVDKEKSKQEQAEVKRSELLQEVRVLNNLERQCLIALKHSIPFVTLGKLEEMANRIPGAFVAEFCACAETQGFVFISKELGKILIQEKELDEKEAAILTAKESKETEQKEEDPVPIYWDDKQFESLAALISATPSLSLPVELELMLELNVKPIISLINDIKSLLKIISSARLKKLKLESEVILKKVEILLLLLADLIRDPVNLKDRLKGLKEQFVELKQYLTLVIFLVNKFKSEIKQDERSRIVSLSKKMEKATISIDESVARFLQKVNALQPFPFELAKPKVDVLGLLSLRLDRLSLHLEYLMLINPKVIEKAYDLFELAKITIFDLVQNPITEHYPISDHFHLMRRAAYQAFHLVHMILNQVLQDLLTNRTNREIHLENACRECGELKDLLDLKKDQLRTQIFGLKEADIKLQRQEQKKFTSKTARYVKLLQNYFIQISRTLLLEERISTKLKTVDTAKKQLEVARVIFCQLLDFPQESPKKIYAQISAIHDRLDGINNTLTDGDTSYHLLSLLWLAKAKALVQPESQVCEILCKDLQNKSKQDIEFKSLFTALYPKCDNDLKWHQNRLTELKVENEQLATRAKKLDGQLKIVTAELLKDEKISGEDSHFYEEKVRKMQHRLNEQMGKIQEEQKHITAARQDNEVSIKRAEGYIVCYQKITFEQQDEKEINITREQLAAAPEAPELRCAVPLPFLAMS